MDNNNKDNSRLKYVLDEAIGWTILTIGTALYYYIKSLL